MAKKKNKAPKKKTSSRRRRIGAISSSNKDLLMKTLGGIGGAVVGSFVGNSVQKIVEKNVSSMANYSQYINGATQFALGYFLPNIIKKSSPMLTGVQLGMCISGGLTAVKATGALDSIAGIADYIVPKIAGTNYMPQPTAQLQDVRSNPVAKVAGMGARNRAMAIAANAA